MEGADYRRRAPARGRVFCRPQGRNVVKSNQKEFTDVRLARQGRRDHGWQWRHRLRHGAGARHGGRAHRHRARNAAKSAAAVELLQIRGRPGAGHRSRRHQRRLRGAPLRAGAGPLRPRRHPRQQRRHQHPQARSVAGIRGMAAGRRHQSRQRIPLLPRGVSAYEERRWRQDHQHRFDALHFRRRICAGLWREQGRRRAAHEIARVRVGRGQHPGERGAARLGEYRPHAQSARGSRRPARARARAHASAALGRSCGFRRHRHIPGERRIELHHRRRDSG